MTHPRLATDRTPMTACKPFAGPPQRTGTETAATRDYGAGTANRTPLPAQPQALPLRDSATAMPPSDGDREKMTATPTNQPCPSPISECRPKRQLKLRAPPLDYAATKMKALQVVLVITGNSQSDQLCYLRRTNTTATSAHTDGAIRL